jgi:hypothetical protein
LYTSPEQTEKLNKSVVSGIFQSSGTTITGDQFSSPQQESLGTAANTDGFLRYASCDKVLGDCCAEYIEERDEVICFGGRATESNTEAHAELAVLDFSQKTQEMVGYQEQTLEGKWLYNKYPPMPHPRWSAASVLIRGLVRNGEEDAHDRIFIIGGRNADGLVPEVDVFRLTDNTWETDWKGLDQGELEEIPASLGGGGGITINITGGDGVQSVRAGNGVVVSGDRRNPVVSLIGIYG